VELSINGSSWTDVSGLANSVKVDGGERAVSEFFTLNGDTPVLTKGKRSSLEVTLMGLYTEVASELYDLATAAYEAGSALYIRWSPKGGASTNFRYTSSVGIVTKPVYPAGAADSADAVATEITLKVASITKSAVP
jgi:hypothetical protein